MTQNQVGCQTVGCRVTSCRYNDKGSYCELSRIQIEPCCCKNSGNGDPADESLCRKLPQKIKQKADAGLNRFKSASA